jgi:hypothetical protein
MITTDWNYLYKIDYFDRTECTTNLLYTPRINPERNVLCMTYDETEEYQKSSTGLTTDLVNFFFERELRYLEIFQDRTWAPKILEVDKETRSIFIEFGKETFNHIIMNPDRNSNEECPDWKEQIWNIIKDIDSSGYYKLALYPHCFFLDSNKQVKTIDFYSIIEKDNCMLERSKIEGMIGKDSTCRFDDSTIDGMVDFSVFFKKTMLEHLNKRWPDNPFPKFYLDLDNV